MPKKITKEQFDALLESRPEGIDEASAREALTSMFASEKISIADKYAHEIDAEEASKWKEAHPFKAAIERAAGPGRVIGGAIGALSGGIKKTYEALPEQTGPWGPLGPGIKRTADSVFTVGRLGREAFVGLEKGASDAMSRPPAGLTPSGVRLRQEGLEWARRWGEIGETLWPVPSDAGEAGVMGLFGAAGKYGPKMATKAGSKLGGFIQEGGALEQRIGRLSETAEAMLARRKIPALQKAVEGIFQKKLELRHQLGERTRIPDYGEFGEHLQEIIKDQADASQEALAASRNTLTDYASRWADERPFGIRGKPLGKNPVESGLTNIEDVVIKGDSPALIVEKAKGLHDELTHVINTSQDTSTIRLIKKYTDLEVPEIEQQVLGKGPYKKNLTIRDLQSDSTALFERAKALSRQGHKRQSRALWQLRETVEDEISRRMSFDPALQKAYQENRAGWRAHFEKFDSELADKLRNSDPSTIIKEVFKSHETVTEAQRLLPQEAWQELKAVKTAEIIDELQHSNDPVKKLRESKDPGYYERIYGKHDAARLEDFARQVSGEKEILKKINEIESVHGFKPKNLKDLGRMMGFSGLGGVIWALNAPYIATASLAIGVAPELMARAYLKMGPTARQAVEALVKERGQLGQLSTSKNAAVVKALVFGKTAEIKEDEKTRQIKELFKAKKKEKYDEFGNLRGRIDPRITQQPGPTPEEAGETYTWPVR